MARTSWWRYIIHFNFTNVNGRDAARCKGRKAKREGLKLKKKEDKVHQVVLGVQDGTYKNLAQAAQETKTNLTVAVRRLDPDISLNSPAVSGFKFNSGCKYREARDSVFNKELFTAIKPMDGIQVQP
jgi:hypothetical protein